MNSRAAVLYEAEAPLEVRDIDVAAPRAGEVRVRVTAAGLCHIDLSVIEGKIPQPLPAVLGHEATGIVESVGADVASVAPGDSVLLVYRASCGYCRYCASGRPGLCELAVRIRSTGRLLDGSSRYSDGERELFHFSGVSAFSELVVVPESAAVKVDGALPADALSVIGCAVLTGFGAAVNAAEIRPGESAVVIGCGGIGLNVIQGCRVSGADPIIAVDLAEDKLELARRFGATHTIASGEMDMVEEVKRLTGDGADYVFEAVGAPALIEQGIAALRRGGTVIVIGAPAPSAKLELSPLLLLAEEKVVKGSLYGSSNFRIDIPKIIGLWQSGRLEIEELVQSRWRLDDINEAFGAMRDGQLGRSVVEMAA